MKSKEQILSRIEESSPLPSLPHILVKLIDFCDNDDVPISNIAPLVAKDSSLSSSVLRLVNSAYFGLNRTFSSLDQAVVFLGAGTIKNLAITASVQQVFKGIRKNSGFNLGSFWYQSLLCATLGKRIGQAANLSNLEEAYLAGLLHNIGQLLLFVSFPKELTLSRENSANVLQECAEEERLIGITHCEAGSWLLKKWKINTFIADATLYHHQRIEQIKEGFPLVKITYLAACLAESSDEELDTRLGLADVLLGLGRERMLEIVTDAKEEVIEIAQGLNIDIQLDTTSPPVTQKDTQHSLAGDTTNDVVNNQTFKEKNLELVKKIQHDSLLTGFLKKLIQTEERDSILAATEEIIRILFTCETVFFLLSEDDGHRLVGHASFVNRHKELVQDLILPAANNSSLAFKSLADNTIIRFSRNDKHENTNLADLQLINVANGKTIMYVPLLAQQEPVGVIVLSIPEVTGVARVHQRKQLQLIADQTAIALYLEEMKHKEAQKLYNERMATASLAARKVIHEVNNPLGIISNYLKLLEMKIPDKTEIQEELQILGEEITRVSTTIEQFSNFSSPSTQHAEELKINEVISNMLRILIPSLLKPADVQVHFTPDLLLQAIRTKKDPLKQILLNLIKNSVEAMDNGGTISIATINIHENDTPKSVLITIEDDGPGIPKPIKAKLFSPFMTTKNHGHSGLGLSIVQKLVQELGGKILCESGQAEGTRFQISLPLNLSDSEIRREGYHE